MSEPTQQEQQPTEQAPEADAQTQQQEETFSREYVEKLRRENATLRTTNRDT